MKDRFVGEEGDDSEEWCGTSELAACSTVGQAVAKSLILLSSTITVLGGSYGSERETISVGEKKIIVVGKGRETTSIGTGALSPSSTTLFSVSSGKLDVQHVKIDHNATASSSLSVFVVSEGSGSLSLEDVLISSGVVGGDSTLASVFDVIRLSQLTMCDVEVIDLELSQSLFSEQPSNGLASGESVLGNVTIGNVNRTTGDGVVVAKKVKEGETFVVRNTTIVDCECESGSGGGMKVELEGTASKARIGTSALPSGVTTRFDRCKCSAHGGGVMAWLGEGAADFVMESVSFVDCCAGMGGGNVFVSGWDLSKIVNKEHFKWEMGAEELESFDELCGWERKTTGEEYVIPLVVYLWSNWSGEGFVDGEGGGDFSGCGFSVVPCSSVDHVVSLRYSPLETEESAITIKGNSSINHPISLLASSSAALPRPKIVIEGEERGRIVRVSEGDAGGDERAMIASDVRLTIADVSFHLPGELGRHVSLVESLSPSGCLSVAHCSFVCGSPPVETKYCVMEVEAGNVTIEDCSLDQFSLMGGFLRFASGVEVVEVVNMSISNTNSAGCSLISLSPSSRTSRVANDENQNSKTMLRINGSSFTNITCGDNRSAVASMDSFAVGIVCVMEGCALTKCMSERSEEGGGVKVQLKSGESELRVRECSFGMCVCSAGNGRGGGKLIDGIEPNAQSGGASALPLLIRMERIRFMMNEAHVGKDMFIRCDSIDLQINEKLFSMDFSQEALKSNNSICGSDVAGMEDVDLIPWIIYYSAPQVFVWYGGRDGRQCGAQDAPCESIDNGITHIEKGVGNAMWIDGEGMVGGECVVGGARIASKKKAKARVLVSKKIEARGEEESVVVFVEGCVVEKCMFVFGVLFESTHKWIMKEKNGSLVMRECSFECWGMGNVVNSSIVGVEGGEFEMNKCSIAHMVFLEQFFRSAVHRALWCRKQK
ncbi:uncharacterized protein MONOS_7768 [Monocercomonoides exilis]|uniref:uncharacterized protein n=1 Tax=Monocercomonoides exilis TaxID=2049356 RepID=UPI00355A7C85|nr:hypothetical protein MONOS_7768 [Monocercomonoides exilis]|eukprot:MONOS_7768.1-p1 / transcript=MONOS_7768.1 / gene=MONOS_7768 / organism=Monocercomonoides_exilis_PA203 / gene_product=unspecified product / transcript_product=unspecified product / location=Mono_scaffold00274:34825-37650(+) / protein_length=942 / sequence_SO=supercontig / SO=protein_coding / is_pseudo=false